MVAERPGRRSRRDQSGQASVLIVGFAVLLLMAIALVVDASAAYLQRQSLLTLADGAALRGADLAATGQETYTSGLDEERLQVSVSAARRAVDAYLRDVEAGRRFPGLDVVVDVDGATSTVSVELSAPLDLPLRIPGGPEEARIGARGSAVVNLDPE